MRFATLTSAKQTYRVRAADISRACGTYRAPQGAYRVRVADILRTHSEVSRKICKRLARVADFSLDEEWRARARARIYIRNRVRDPNILKYHGKYASEKLVCHFDRQYHLQKLFFGGLVGGLENHGDPGGFEVHFYLVSVEGTERLYEITAGKADLNVLA